MFARLLRDGAGTTRETPAKNFLTQRPQQMLAAKGKPEPVAPVSGFVSVQLRFDSKLTLAEYVSQKSWLSATLPSCPLHGSDCRLRSKGYYWRKYPEPLAIARLYCKRARTTFSLLPDFLSSRYRGTLAEFEEVCVMAERADCLEVANTVRPVEVASNITERSAQRWVGRRVVLLNAALLALLGVLAEQLQGVRTAAQLRQRFAGSADSEVALVALRAIVVANLAALGPPLGFGPWPKLASSRASSRPHTMGPEPPAPTG